MHQMDQRTSISKESIYIKREMTIEGICDKSVVSQLRATSRSARKRQKLSVSPSRHASFCSDRTRYYERYNGVVLNLNPTYISLDAVPSLPLNMSQPTSALYISKSQPLQLQFKLENHVRTQETPTQTAKRLVLLLCHYLTLLAEAQS